MSRTRKDLANAAAGIYIVKCRDAKSPRDDDPVLEGPLDATTREQQDYARNRARWWAMRAGARTDVELVQVISLDAPT
jgi:hypothetical protein